MFLTTCIILNHMPHLPENPSHVWRQVWQWYRWTTDSIKVWFDFMKVLTIITLTQHVMFSVCTGTYGAGTLLTAPVLCSGLRKNKITLGSSMLKKGTIFTSSKRPGEYCPVDAVCSRIVSYNQLMESLTFFCDDNVYSWFSNYWRKLTLRAQTCCRPVSRSSTCACQNTTKERSSLGTRAPCFMSCCLQREVWHIRPNAALLCGSVGGLEDKERRSLSDWKHVLTTFNWTHFLGSKSEIKPPPMKLI